MSLSDTLFERAKKVAPGGVHSPIRAFGGMDRSPIFFKEGKGAYLTSVDNKKYVDYCLSFGPLILGHLDSDVQTEVRKMIDTAWTFGACEPYSLELAEWITSHVPYAEKVRFVSSGTEAVMSALRVARAATNRKKILKFEGCFHGSVDSLLVQAGSGLAGASASSSAGISRETAELTLVAPLDNEQAVQDIFAKHGSDIAAVIIEPLPANYGLLIQRNEFLKFISLICKQHGALLIFDEVISGFRVGQAGMAEKTDIHPDLVTYGKIIGGGFPVGCYGGRKELMDLVAPNGPVYQAGTLSGNPIGMVAGLATLKKLKEQNVWKTLESRTKYFSEKLQAGFDENSLPYKVEHYASLFWIHTAPNTTIRSINQIPSTQKETFKNLFLKSLDKGIYLAPNAYEVGFMSLAHTEDILDHTVKTIIEAATGK